MEVVTMEEVKHWNWRHPLGQDGEPFPEAHGGVYLPKGGVVTQGDNDGVLLCCGDKSSHLLHFHDISNDQSWRCDEQVCTWRRRFGCVFQDWHVGPTSDGADPHRLWMSKNEFLHFCTFLMHILIRQTKTDETGFCCIAEIQHDIREPNWI